MEDSGQARHVLTRRRLLRLGAGLGGAALLASSTAAWVLWPRPSAPGRRVLSSDEERVVQAIAEAYLPEGNPFGVAARDVDIVQSVDEYIGALPRTQGRLLRGLLAALEQWPRATLSSTRTLSALPLEERIAVLRAFETSRLKERRQLAGLLRLLVAIPYFEDPRVMAAGGVGWGCGVFS